VVLVSDESGDPVLPGDEDARRGLVVPIGAVPVRTPVVKARADAGSMGPLHGGRIAVSGNAGDEMGGIVQWRYELVHGVSY
jgi:hypothetical protein